MTTFIIYIYKIYIYNISRLRPNKSGKQNRERERDKQTHTQTIAKVNYRFLTPVEKAMKSLNINYWAKAYAFARFTLGPVKWASVPCPSLVHFVRMMAWEQDLTHRRRWRATLTIKVTDYVTYADNIYICTRSYIY